MSLEELNNLIFENSNNMNEGIYLQLMNATKNMFQKEKIQHENLRIEEKQRENEIKQKEEEIKQLKNELKKTHLELSNFKKNEPKEHRKYLLNKIEKHDNETITLFYNDMSVMKIKFFDYIKVMDFGRDEIYYCLKNITNTQCQFKKYHFKYVWVEDNHKCIEETITIKFNVNQKHKNIIFYGSLDPKEAYDMYSAIDEISMKDEE